jgi:hypothetical protein
MRGFWVVAGAALISTGGCKTAAPVQPQQTEVGSGGKTAGTPAPPAQPTRPIAVELKVEAVTHKGQGFIDGQEILRSGDKLALHVSLSEAAYVYVGLLAADGSRSVVFPGGESTLFDPGADHRIPAAGQWFKLDRDTGQEDIFVYASRKPLTQDQTMALIAQDAAQVRAQAPKPAPKAKRPRKTTAVAPPDDAPSGLSPDTRGLAVVTDEPVDTKADLDLTRTHFPIRHHK